MHAFDSFTLSPDRKYIFQSPSSSLRFTLNSQKKKQNWVKFYHKGLFPLGLKFEIFDSLSTY